MLSKSPRERPWVSRQYFVGTVLEDMHDLRLLCLTAQLPESRSWSPFLGNSSPCSFSQHYRGVSNDRIYPSCLFWLKMFGCTCQGHSFHLKMPEQEKEVPVVKMNKCTLECSYSLPRGLWNSAPWACVPVAFSRPPLFAASVSILLQAVWEGNILYSDYKKTVRFILLTLIVFHDIMLVIALLNVTLC